MKNILFISLCLIIGFTSCEDKVNNDDENPNGGGSSTKMTLRSIQWNEGGRIDSIKFTYQFSLTGFVGTMQESYQGAKLISRKSITNKSGYSAFLEEYTENSLVPICGIGGSSIQYQLLRFTEGLQSIPDTIVYKTITLLGKQGGVKTLISEIRYANEGIDKFEYDTNLNLIKSTFKDGAVTTYTYDDKVGFWGEDDRFAWLCLAMDGIFSQPANMVNNVLTEVRTDKDKNTENVTYKYTYDSNNYPLTMKVSSDKNPTKEYKINYDVRIIINE